MDRNLRRESSSNLFTPQASDATFGLGGGDSNGNGSHPHDKKPNPMMQKFCNGVPVPVFSDDQVSEGDNADVPWTGKFPGVDSDELAEIMGLYKCPICMDFMIEATAAACGHTFCAACLNKWTNEKPICPICSKQVSCRVRLYNTDLFIEKMIRRCDDFPSEIGRKLYEATKARMDHQMAEKESVLGKIRNHFNDVVTSLRCKGLWTTLVNSSPSIIIRRTVMEKQVDLKDLRQSISTSGNTYFENKKFYLMIGIIIGALLAYGFNNFTNSSNFFEYMYLCLVSYNGTIPYFLRDAGNVVESIKTPVGDVSDFESQGGFWDMTYKKFISVFW